MGVAISSTAMSASRPTIRPIGPVWREIRLEVGATQAEVGDVLGLGKGGQTAISYREKAPEPGSKAIEPSPDELARFEDHYGLQRGTVLRRAGYVVDGSTPLEQIDSWSFLSEPLREAIKRMVQPEWEKAGRPGYAGTLRSVRGQRR